MTTTVYYYGAQGRAQQIRFTLVEGGIEFEDDKAAYPPSAEAKAKWKAAGGLNTTTNVPMLAHGGKSYTQSSAVLRKAARLAGLYPADDELAYDVDNMIAAVDDYRTAAYSIIFGAKSAEAVAAHRTAMALHFANFERLLGESDFFVGGTITVADLTAFDSMNNFGFNLLPSAAADHPKLVAFCDRIKARPKIAAYMASEAYTTLMPFGSLE